jgi:Flp pilus assembly protein TadD
MQTLEASGNRAGALQHAAVHERLLRAELDLDPPAEVTAFVARLRREPAPGRATSAAAHDAGGTTTTFAHGESVSRAPSSLSSPSSMAAAPAPRGLGMRHGVAALVVAAALVAAWVGIAHSGRSASRETKRPAAMRTPASRPRPGTKSIAAYELYRRGSDRTRFRSDSAVREGVEVLQQSVALDPTYAAPWAALALFYDRLGEREPRQGRARYDQLAVDAARKAVVLDDSLAQAHATLGLIMMRQYDVAAAERELMRAVALDSTRPELHEYLVRLDLFTGRPADALVHGQRAVALDTLSPTAHAELARALLGNDRCDETLAQLGDLMELRPPLLRAADIAAQCYARKRMWSAAIAAQRRGVERGEAAALAKTGYLLARAGRRQEALAFRDSLLARWNHGDAVAFEVGLVSVGLADFDGALDWFERGIADHSLDIGGAALWLVLPGPVADDLRGRPRFEHLLARLGRRDQKR